MLNAWINWHSSQFKEDRNFSKISIISSSGMRPALFFLTWFLKNQIVDVEWYQMLLGASLKEIIHLPSCNLLIWWITIDFILLNHTCISGVNINPFSCSWPELSYMTIYNEKETLHVLKKKGRWVWWIATSLCNTGYVNCGPTRTVGATGGVQRTNHFPSSPLYPQLKRTKG